MKEEKEEAQKDVRLDWQVRNPSKHVTIYLWTSHFSLQCCVGKSMRCRDGRRLQREKENDARSP